MSIVFEKKKKLTKKTKNWSKNEPKNDKNMKKSIAKGKKVCYNIFTIEKSSEPKRVLL